MMEARATRRVATGLCFVFVALLVASCVRGRRGEEDTYCGSDRAWRGRWNEWYLKEPAVRLEIVRIRPIPIAEEAGNTAPMVIVDVRLRNCTGTPIAVPSWLAGHGSRFMAPRVLDFYVTRDGKMTHAVEPYGLRRLSFAAHPIASDGPPRREGVAAAPGRSHAIGIYGLPISRDRTYKLWCTLCIPLGDAPWHREEEGEGEEALYMRSNVLTFVVGPDGVPVDDPF